MAAKNYGGYSLSVRTHDFTITDFSISRSWSRERDWGDEPSRIVIRGTASSTDPVGIIGEAGSVRSLHAIIVPDTNPAKRWAWFRGNDPLLWDEFEFEEQTKLLIETFDKDPFTACLGHDPGAWFLECWIAEDFLNSIVSGIEKGQVEKLMIGIKWVAGLRSHQHAPRAQWGLQSWSRFLRQPVKVDRMTRRMIHHEDAQTVHGRVQGEGRA